MTDAMQYLESLGKPGFYRVVQTRRMVWAEMESGKLRLRRWHASSPEGLARTADAFQRDGGKYPVEKAREERKRVKRSRKSKQQ